jgi:hypothetical protein
MTRIAEKGKNSLLGIVFEEAMQFKYHLVTVFNLRVNQRQLLIRSESESVDDFVELALVVEYPRQVAVGLYESIFADF